MADTTEALIELSRHKTWATLGLIEHCQTLDDEILDATTPGTYGTIRATLHHLIDADEDYLSMLIGEHLWDPIGDRRLPIAELAERFRQLAPRWEALAEDASLSSREAVADDGVRMPAAVPLAQAITPPTTAPRSFRSLAPLA